MSMQFDAVAEELASLKKHSSAWREGAHLVERLEKGEKERQALKAELAKMHKERGSLDTARQQAIADAQKQGSQTLPCPVRKKR